MKEKLDNFLKIEKEIITRIQIIQKDPMTDCDIYFIHERIKELDQLEARYRELFFELMKKPTLPGLRTQAILAEKPEQELCLNFEKNIKWIWNIVEVFSEQIKQMQRQAAVVFNAERENVFDLDSIEKRLSQSKTTSQARRDSFFKNEDYKQNTPSDSTESQKVAEGQETYTVLPEYFADSMK